MAAAEQDKEGAPEVRAASAVLFRDGRVLLVMRGKQPRGGLWSLPGGKLEPGESDAEAAVREVREETGLAAELAGLLCEHEVATTAARYRIAVFYGRAAPGEPSAACDAAAATFVSLDYLDRYALTDGLAAIVRRAARALGA
jgi:8-oxo-dGTP diphosphatase